MSNAGKRWLRRRLVVPTAVMVLLLGAVLIASAAAPPNIDTFATTQASLNATAGAPASGIVSDGGVGGIMGSQREVYASVTGTGNLAVSFNGSVVSISTAENTVGTTTLTYDGAANSNPDPNNVAPVGLCTAAGVACKDLTEGGATNAFRIVVPSDDTFGTLKVTVWGGDTGTGTCSRTITNFFPGGFPIATPPAREFFFEYPAILAGTCSGNTTNLFSKAGAIQFQISGAALDMTIDTIDISVLDWGDLPQTDPCTSSFALTRYATTQACQGPRHGVTPGLLLGASIDPRTGPPQLGEFNGQPTNDAKGDDNTQLDDEDGVTPVDTWVNGGTGSVEATVQGTGYLVGWIDWQNDGFTASDVVINQSVTPGTATYNFAVPAGTLPLPPATVSLYARFRLFPAGEITSAVAPYAFDGRDQFNQFTPLGLRPPGQSRGGEVEDYLWTLSGSVLAVTLASFDAEARADHVLLSWETVSEVNNEGFNLYRNTSPSEPGEQINLSLIPSQAPGSAQGAIYTWQDADVEDGQTYYYWLEDVDLAGATSLHGPVSATYQAPTAVVLSDFAAVQPLRSARATAALAGAALAGCAALALLRRRGRAET